MKNQLEISWHLFGSWRALVWQLASIILLTGRIYARLLFFYHYANHNAVTSKATHLPPLQSLINYVHNHQFPPIPPVPPVPPTLAEMVEQVEMAIITVCHFVTFKCLYLGKKVEICILQ